MESAEQHIERFAKLAAEYSIEQGSRALGGVVPPIQRHGGQPALEREAFNLKPGELSGVIQIGNNYIILLSEGLTQPVVREFADVRHLLHQDILERKYRIEMAKRFEAIIKDAHVVNQLDPRKSRLPKKDQLGERQNVRATESPERS